MHSHQASLATGGLVHSHWANLAVGGLVQIWLLMGWCTVIGQILAAGGLVHSHWASLAVWLGC